jgi:two-component sensor histidine kinase
MRVGDQGQVSYASPNAVSIMRLAGVEGRVTGRSVAELPGGNVGISPVLGAHEAVAVAAEADVAERVLGYRTLAVESGAVVLVEDLTQARAREHEIRVKQTTIREIHHRVKNNLQTIASLLRMQARRSESIQSRRALSEAIERVSSMAVVHDMLAGSEGERIDFAAAARTIVDLVRRGLVGEESGVTIEVMGETGVVDARVATSLAMALAELVHNALEHGFEPGAPGHVSVRLTRTPAALTVAVSDDGRGLPPDLDPHRSPSLGLTIVRTVVEDDLRGTLSWSGTGGERDACRAAGTSVTIEVPLSDVDERPATAEDADRDEGSATGRGADKETGGAG